MESKQRNDRKESRRGGGGERREPWTHFHSLGRAHFQSWGMQGLGQLTQPVSTEHEDPGRLAPAGLLSGGRRVGSRAGCPLEGERPAGGLGCAQELGDPRGTAPFLSLSFGICKVVRVGSGGVFVYRTASGL